MLLMIMELCKVCSQEKSAKRKMALKERMALAKHQLLMEAAGEYRCELQIDPEGASDDFFELKGFMNDCELYCYECSRGIGQQAKVFLVIDEYLQGLSGDCQEMMARTDKAQPAKAEVDGSAEGVSGEVQAAKPAQPKVRDLALFRKQRGKDR
jgi:hypothetical protein